MSEVVALDPGKLTGIAQHPGFPDGDLVAFHKPAEEAMFWLHRELESEALRPEVVVCEDIVITVQTAKKSQDVKISIEQIGISRYLCGLFGVPFVLQTPSDAKGFSTNEKLRRIGWWTKGSDHARDATRHLMLYRAEREPDFRKSLLSSG